MLPTDLFSAQLRASTKHKEKVEKSTTKAAVATGIGILVLWAVILFNL